MLSNLEILYEYTLTGNGNRFLIHDSGPSEDRFMIFSTTRSLNFMSHCCEWFADGSFSVAPQPFSHVYAIHAIGYHNIITTVIVLMANNQKNSFDRVFDALKFANKNLKPMNLMTNYENSSIISFKNAFPNVLQRGSFFHLCQCLWRQIQKNAEIYDKYINDPEFALYLRTIVCLAFVSTNDIVVYFEALIKSTFLVQNKDLLKSI